MSKFIVIAESLSGNEGFSSIEFSYLWLCSLMAAKLAREGWKVYIHEIPTKDSKEEEL